MLFSPPSGNSIGLAMSRFCTAWERRRFLGLILTVAALPRVVVAAPPVFQIGVMPYLPTNRLIAGHQTLRRFLASRFGREAAVSTAPDFPRFQQRTLAGEYDLVVTGPPLAWAAYRAGVVVPIAVATRPLRIHVAVAKNSSARGLTDLRGKTIGVLPPPSFAPTILADMLRAHGLKAGSDVTLSYDSIPYNSVLATTLGEIEAAAYPTVSLPSLPADLLDRVRTLEVSAEFPAAVFCARRAPDVPPPEALQSALLHFANETPEGAEFVRDMGHEGLRMADLQAMKSLDRFLPNAG